MGKKVHKSFGYLKILLFSLTVKLNGSPQYGYGGSISN